MLLETILKNLQAEGLFSTPRTPHVLLAYSGGHDSTALLHLLARLRETHPLKITAAYYNHNWRGNPVEELPLIDKNCRACHVPLVMIAADRTLPKTEQHARARRYRELTRLAHDIKADAVLTAHHADDQVETLLFRILRGTGIDGLAGIQRRLVLEASAGHGVPILRPMLDIARQPVSEFLKEQNIPYFTDPTNLNNAYQRNNLRNKVIPFLEGYFPQVKNSLFKLSILATGDLELVDEQLGKIIRRVCKDDAKGAFLDSMVFNQLGVPYQRRVMKSFLSEQGIEPDFQLIEEAIAFVEGAHRKSLSSGLMSLESAEKGHNRFLSLYRGEVRILQTENATVQAFSSDVEPVAFNPTGQTEYPALQARIRAVELSGPERKKAAKRISKLRQNEVYVDLSGFTDKLLVLRTRKPGDRIQPLGMDVPMRLKKLLINKGIPRFEREKLPLLAFENKILWAPGVGLGQEIKVRREPTHLLRLEIGPVSAEAEEEWLANLKELAEEVVEKPRPEVPPPPTPFGEEVTEALEALNDALDDAELIEEDSDGEAVGKSQGTRAGMAGEDDALVLLADDEEEDGPEPVDNAGDSREW